MVDWATRDRLYPSGYQATNVRYRRTTIDSSLPFSMPMNKSKISRGFACRMKGDFLEHHCGIKTRKSEKNEIVIESLRHGLNHSYRFYDQISADAPENR